MSFSILCFGGALYKPRAIFNFFGVDYWMNRETITEEDINTYPKAKEAYDIKNSPLYKALNESEDSFINEGKNEY